MRDILEAAAKVMSPQEVLSNHRSPRGQSWVVLKSFPGWCCEYHIVWDSVSLLVNCQELQLNQADVWRTLARCASQPTGTSLSLGHPSFVNVCSSWEEKPGLKHRGARSDLEAAAPPAALLGLASLGKLGSMWQSRCLFSYFLPVLLLPWLTFL